jgi:hypothetical protein
MKTLKLLVMALLSGALLLGCKNDDKTKITSKPAVIDEITVGMTADEIKAKLGTDPDKTPAPNKLVWAKGDWRILVTFDDSGKATDVQKGGGIPSK